MFAWLKQMLAQDVPINGVGDQGHLDTQFGFSGTQMTQDLQRYASLGLKVAITEADVRTFVNNATDQVPTEHLATFAQPDSLRQMLKACLAVSPSAYRSPSGVRGRGLWVPGFFTGEGYATIYDVNLNPSRLHRTPAGPPARRLRRPARCRPEQACSNGKRARVPGCEGVAIPVGVPGYPGRFPGACRARALSL